MTERRFPVLLSRLSLLLGLAALASAASAAPRPHPSLRLRSRRRGPPIPGRGSQPFLRAVSHPFSELARNDGRGAHDRLSELRTIANGGGPLAALAREQRDLLRMGVAAQLWQRARWQEVLDGFWTEEPADREAARLALLADPVVASSARAAARLATSAFSFAAASSMAWAVFNNSP